jgi:hypothetical protein
MIKISYALCFYNETKEMVKLIDFLLKNKDQEDEIIILWDEENGSIASFNEINDLYKEKIKLIKNKLQNNFSQHKNFLKYNCSGEWIFNLDADETIELETFLKIKDFLKSEKSLNIDLICIPRVNIVHGLTKEYLKEETIKKKWKINKFGWINFPDFQARIFRNKEQIKWIRPIHEIISGASAVYYLPETKEYSIMHEKNISIQIKQNLLYNSINKDIK